MKTLNLALPKFIVFLFVIYSMKYIFIAIIFVSVLFDISALEEKQGTVSIDSEFIKKSESEFEIILDFDIEKDWYIYWKNPGDSGIPTKFEWDLPGGIKLNSEEWEIPEIFPYDEFASIGYKNKAKFKFSFSSEAELSKINSIGCKVSWLICKEGCYSGYDTLKIDLKPKGFFKSLFSLFGSRKGNYPIQDNEIESFGRIEADSLMFEFKNAEGINDIHSVMFLSEDIGFLSTTGQKFKLENDVLKMTIMLDELRESEPEKLNGILIIKTKNKKIFAYKLFVNLK